MLAQASTQPTCSGITAHGDVSLGGTLKVSDAVKPTATSAMPLLITNDSTAPIQGAFLNTDVVVHGVTFAIDYQGGDGNDLTLTKA